MNGFKDSLFVGAVPAEPSVADDMVGRYETEMAGIYRLVGIIGQYPIVVLLEKKKLVSRPSKYNFPSRKEALPSVSRMMISLQAVSEAASSG